MISRKLEWLLTLSFLSLLSPFLYGQAPLPSPRAVGPTAPQRLIFEEAKRLLEGEAEGNISKRPGTYSETRLRNGQVLEVYYPLGVQTSRSTGKGRTGRSTSVAGYGLLHESAAAYEEARRPRHVLEELLPDGQGFVAQVPELIAKLEKRLRVGSGRLDLSRSGLKRVDAYLASYRRTHTTADTDPALFQEMTAYYGEVLKRELAGEWRMRSENIAQKRAQQVPNIAFELNGKRRELRPWSGVLDVLYNEDQRGLTVSAAFEADLKAARP